MDGEQTVLVTGGSGFLGGWCVVDLLARGYRVRTTVRDPAREGELRAKVASQVDPGDRLTVLIADLNGDRGWAEAADGCDYVLHVASPFPPAQPKDPDELIAPARDGTLRVLRASLAAGVKRVVVTSSVAIAETAASISLHAISPGTILHSRQGIAGAATRICCSVTGSTQSIRQRRSILPRSAARRHQR